MALRFFFDNDVPDDAAEVCRDAGHEVIFMREKLPTNSPDIVVAVAAELEDAILVCFDKDHKRIAPRLRRLALIRLECTQPRAAARLGTAMSFIEAEHEIAQASKARFFVTIGKETIRSRR